MHHVDQAEFLLKMSAFLCGYYVLLALANGIMALHLWTQAQRVGEALVWTGVAVLFMIASAIAGSGNPGLMQLVSLPEWVRLGINPWLANATVYSVGTLVILAVMFVFRRFFVQPSVAWAIFNIATLAMGLSMTDPNFADIVTKPDNVPIVGLVFLLGYFTWLSASIAVENDERM
jgi:hypothetical protein